MGPGETTRTRASRSILFAALGGTAIVIASALPEGARFAGYDVFGMIPPPTSDKDDEKSRARYSVIASGEARGLGGARYYGYEEDLLAKAVLAPNSEAIQRREPDVRPAAARVLVVEDNNVNQLVAIGHEQTDTDPGLATSRQDFSLETYVLDQGRWQIELMANLDGLPESGAAVVASWPKPLGGSGFPARVFAIC